MTLALPASLESAFQVSAAELGWCSASRLFVRELHDAGGRELVARASDRLGREYPVFGCVAGHFLGGAALAPVDVGAVVDALAGAKRVVIIGQESDFIDALLPRLPDVELGLVTLSHVHAPDWRRVLANYRERVRSLALDDVQRWAGRSSALLTFVYGANAYVAHVGSAWLRVVGPDVRTQFRALVGWDVLGTAMELYPRWLVATDVADFSRLVSA